MFSSKLYFRNHALHHQGELSNFFLHPWNLFFFLSLPCYPLFGPCYCPVAPPCWGGNLLQFVDLDVELLTSACHTNLQGLLLTCYNILWSSCYGVNITNRTLLTRIVDMPLRARTLMAPVSVCSGSLEAGESLGGTSFGLLWQPQNGGWQSL